MALLRQCNSVQESIASRSADLELLDHLAKFSSKTPPREPSQDSIAADQVKIESLTDKVSELLQTCGQEISIISPEEHPDVVSAQHRLAHVERELQKSVEIVRQKQEEVKDLQCQVEEEEGQAKRVIEKAQRDLEVWDKRYKCARKRDDTQPIEHNRPFAKSHYPLD